MKKIAFAIASAMVVAAMFGCAGPAAPYPNTASVGDATVSYPDSWTDTSADDMTILGAQASMTHVIAPDGKDSPMVALSEFTGEYAVPVDDVTSYLTSGEASAAMGKVTFSDGSIDGLPTKETTVSADGQDLRVVIVADESGNVAYMLVGGTTSQATEEESEQFDNILGSFHISK